MKLIINGDSKEFDATELKLEALLTEIGMAGKPVVVELNREALLPTDHSTTQLTDGDSVEIVMIAAGG